jgi:thiamine-phosphate pyrophosphorylase
MEMSIEKRKIGTGLYLVVDPALEEKRLLKTLEQVLGENIAGIQLWDNFQPGQNISNLIVKVASLCHSANIPLLINNQWKLLRDHPLDGVHFDFIPNNLEEIKVWANRKILTGITCGNNLTVVRWAEENGLDYISFCSLFPSSTSTSCELVDFDTIQAARTLFRNPIFLAGGIQPETINNLGGLHFEGVAVVSGIMGSQEPAESKKQYLEALKRIKK